MPDVAFQGASVGSVLGLGFMLWVVAGSYLLHTNMGTLEMPTMNCSDIYGNATEAILNVSSPGTSYYIANVSATSSISTASQM